jgi:hypothetical protein
MSKVISAPMMMMGNKEMSMEIVKTDGTIAQAQIESFYMGDDRIGINTQGIGVKMFMILVNDKTTYQLYSTIRRAINAGKKY